MTYGSKKPILDLIPAPYEAGNGPELLPTRDGRRLTAMQILVETHGRLDIALERAYDMEESEFMYALARCHPDEITQGIKAVQLWEVFKLAGKVASKIEEELEDIKPGQLVGFYPKLVELIPALAETKVNVRATQNNYNFPSVGDAPEIPEDIQAAFKRLGLVN